MLSNMFTTGKIALAIMLFLHFGYSVAFWRLECQGTVGLARIDPLMDYGVPSEHVHTIKGGSAFTPTSLSAELLKSKCSSCDVREDLSSYWTPALYFINADNTVEIVPEKPPHKSYYFLNDGYSSTGKKQKIEAFPPGFKMIAGNNYHRNSSIPDADRNQLGPWVGESQALREERALGFTCMNYGRHSQLEGSLMRHMMPDKAFLDRNCADGLRLELMFPSCWNGEVDGGKDHKSHVAYPDGVMTGNCPDGYDRRLVSLFFETIVATDLYKGRDGRFVLSNGDPTGYGFHGDFIEAWKPGVLQQAIDQCTSGTGLQKACKVFSFFDDPGHCRLESMPQEIARENVEGPRLGLPNDIPVEYGPEEATRPRKHGQPYSPVHPADSLRPAAPAPATHIPGPVVVVPPPSTFTTSTSTSLALTPTSSVDVSSAAALLASHADGTPVTTEIYTSGGAVYEVVVLVEEVTVTAATTAGSDSANHLHKRRIHHHGHHGGAHAVAG